MGGQRLIRSIAFASLLACAPAAAPVEVAPDAGRAPQDAGFDTPVEDARAVPAQACMRYFERLRARFSACTDLHLPATRIEDLRVAFQVRCEEIGGYPGSAFDRAWMERCAESVETAPCDALKAVWSFDFASVAFEVVPMGWRNIWPPGCDAPRGARAAGAPCAVGAQCASGRCSGVSECGTCVEVLGEGASCASPDACDARSSCDPATQRCKRRPSTPGARCLDVTCAFGVACDPNQRCSPLMGEGELCNYDQECAGDMVCEGRCARRTAPLGATCGETICERGLFCAESVCAWPRFPSNGAPCSVPVLSRGGFLGGGPCGDGSCTCPRRGNPWCLEPYVCMPDGATGCSGSRDCSRKPLACDVRR